MRSRPRPLSSRILDASPVLIGVAFGMAGVFVAVNVLVTAAPVVFDAGSPLPTLGAGPSLAGTPTILPGNSAAASDSPAPAASLPHSSPVLIHSAVSDRDPGGIWTVYLEYPALELGSSPWAEQIDDMISSDVQTRATQWEQGAAAIRQVAGKTNVLSGTFKTELLSPQLASFTLTWTADASAAGPTTSVETINFDLATGQLISFESLFTDTSQALDIVSAEVRNQLPSILGADYDKAVVDLATTPDLGSFINWAIAPGGIRISFTATQVGGPAPSSVLVAWSLLRSVMVTTGPVAALAGF